jgi:chromosome partitioning protein
VTKVVVIGNEKGGAGKSTIAIHLITGLLHAGSSVAVIDLDLRQRSTARFLASRRSWLAANPAASAPMPSEPHVADDGAVLARAGEEQQLAAFEGALNQVSEDYLIIDTPGGDTALSRAAHALADTIVTPMNDSFVDFDLLGHVDPVTLELKQPSIYSETVWESRKQKAMARRGQIDWVVLSNRLAVADARNRRRLEERMTALAKRVGFRMGPGLRDRVIYRELFPFGLTVADLSPTIRPVSVSLAHVAARQELRNLMLSLGLDEAVRLGDAA